MMPDIRITNCHVHLFTHRHVPKTYPSPLLRPIKRFPWLVGVVAAVVGALGYPAMAEKIRRLKQFHQETQSPSQPAVLENLRRHYPSNTRFVVLPMDLSQIGHGAPPVGLAEQHDELARLAADKELGQSVIPFATIDPRADPEARELWRAIDELKFKGIKLYPRLGYDPADKRLMTHVYPEAERRGLPVMTHCSRGGVQGRSLPDFHADRFTDPMAYVPVMKAHPKLRICLAHFGGQRDWEAYINPQAPSPYHPEYARNWQVMIRHMIASGAWPNLWTDISYTLFNFEDYAPFLRMFLLHDDRDDVETSKGRARLRRRVLFGSDYYMTKQEKLSEKAVSFRLRNALGEDLFRQIAEENPRVWLGERREAPLP
jgi:predicted TIM-barrel fold metal-dependent hydrolase